MNFNISESNKTSFKAITHPLTIFSLFLLILNDHYLKYQYPSNLTGKISDFAGLFFFPFLIAVIINLLIANWSEERIMIFSLIITALWFSLIKLNPFINHLTETILSTITNSPSQIILDPTDLLALISLWPSWKLWEHLKHQITNRKPSRLTYLIIGVATLASLATAGSEEVNVIRLEFFDSQVFAGLGFIYDEGPEVFDYAIGLEEETLWEEIESPPEEIIDVFSKPIQLPKTICQQNQNNVCYRITGEEHIEGSMDNGKTWEIIWKISPDRRLFMERLNVQEFGVYDIALVENGEEISLIAALGEEGVLVWNSNDSWERHRVLYSIPTSVIPNNYNQLISSTDPELFIGFGLTFLFYIILKNWVWAKLPITRKNDLEIHPIYKIIYYGVIITGILTYLDYIGIKFIGRLNNIIFGDFLGYLIWYPSRTISIILLIIVYLHRYSIGWRGRIEEYEHSSIIQPKVFVFSLSLTISFWLPFSLWAYAILNSYTITLLIAIILTLGTATYGFFQIKKALSKVEFLV